MPPLQDYPDVSWIQNGISQVLRQVIKSPGYKKKHIKYICQISFSSFWHFGKKTVEGLTPFCG